MLSDWDQNGLVIGCGVDRGYLVCPSGQSGGDISRNNAIDGGRVQTLEERKLGRVCRRGLRERIERFDNDVGMAHNLPVIIQLLRCREVILLGVDKVSGLEVVDRQRDCESLVGGDGPKVLGGCEFGRGHVPLRGNAAHRSWVAGSSRNLLTVRYGLVRNSGTEVDEIVSGGE